MNLCYPARFEPQQPSGFFVQFIDFDNAITQGENIEECKANAQEVLSLVIEDMLEDGQEIPTPSNSADAFLIAPETLIQSKILLSWLKKPKNIGYKTKSPSLTQLDKAAKAMGKQLVLSIE
jgi:antitoxin HicB